MNRDRPADKYQPMVTQKIPTLLGNDGTTAGNYTNDHPVGQNAHLSNMCDLSATVSPVLLANSAYSAVTAGHPMRNLLPTTVGQHWLLASRATHLAVNGAGQALRLCTTCHNQHVMTVYTSSAASPIAERRGGNAMRRTSSSTAPTTRTFRLTNGRASSIDDPVLPPVPLWRIERSQQHQQHPDRLPVERPSYQGGESILFPHFF